VLSDLSPPADPRVLIDYRTADDAGVFALDEQRALVQTVDFFTPIVDDPRVFGQIAAANALSDVYAMGGEPVTALAIAAFPVRDFDPADIKAIFLGGRDKLSEARVALLGGHTVQDAEVKFGYAVTGLVDPRRVWSNAAARVGDALLLTKPLGTGVVTTALKFGRAPAAALEAAMHSMTSLNDAAARVLRQEEPGTVSACTDVTGFGFIGHASEIADGSGVTLVIEPDAVPLLPFVLDLALRNRPGGGASNEGYFGGKVTWTRDLDAALRVVLFDPQTSGGLLVAVAPRQRDELVGRLRAAGVPTWPVGTVVEREHETALVIGGR
jgi:selenide,water dikinase